MKLNTLKTAIGTILFPASWAIATIGSGLPQEEMYPYVAEVRNGQNAGYRSALVLYPKNHNAFTSEDSKQIRAYLLIAHENYSGLFEKEIHTVIEGAKAVYRGNQQNEGYSDEQFIQAPELGIFRFPLQKYSSGCPYHCGLNAGQIDPHLIGEL